MVVFLCNIGNISNMLNKFCLGTWYFGKFQVPKIKIGYEDGEDLHLFYVRDNGIGIDPEHHLRIFEIFYRLRLKEDKEGTGLGLAIVDRIVKNHGGKVWVESEKDKGATFYFTVPKRSWLL